MSVLALSGQLSWRDDRDNVLFRTGSSKLSLDLQLCTNSCLLIQLTSSWMVLGEHKAADKIIFVPGCQACGSLWSSGEMVAGGPAIFFSKEKGFLQCFECREVFGGTTVLG